MRAFLAATVLLFSLSAFAPAESITSNPAGGVVGGQPGQDIGWGYVFHNDSQFFDVLSFSFLVVADGFGSYQDFVPLPKNFEVIAPGNTSHLGGVFDSATQAGLGEFDLFPSIPPGPIEGTLLIFFDEYTGDPTEGGVAASLGNELAVSVEIDVGGSGTSATPEPALTGCLGLCLVGLYCWARRESHFAPRLSVLSPAKKPAAAPVCRD